MFDHEMRDAAERLLLACRHKKLKVVTAESCTGGLIAATLTAIAGSSDVVDRAFVTYSNEAKRDMIGVPWKAIMTHGAVSEPVARAMAEGALAHSDADLAVSVTGVAGHRYGEVGVGMGERSLGHRARHRLAHRAVGHDRLPRHADHVALGLVGIGDEGAIDDVGRSGNRRQGRGD